VQYLSLLCSTSHSCTVSLTPLQYLSPLYSTSHSRRVPLTPVKHLSLLCSTSHSCTVPPTPLQYLSLLYTTSHSCAVPLTPVSTSHSSTIPLTPVQYLSLLSVPLTPLQYLSPLYSTCHSCQYLSLLYNTSHPCTVPVTPVSTSHSCAVPLTPVQYLSLLSVPPPPLQYFSLLSQLAHNSYFQTIQATNLHLYSHFKRTIQPLSCLKSENAGTTNCDLRSLLQSFVKHLLDGAVRWRSSHCTSSFDVPRAVHRNIISVVKPTRSTNVSNLFYFGMTLYMFRTVFPSIINSSRLYIQQQAFVKQTAISV